ncbi:hypothetical protein HYU14_00585 [Candidatus Woesearchaeota archaeon]|nr:hypothetical protein [Candidatus Woesearchaeota archaeon]
MNPLDLTHGELLYRSGKDAITPTSLFTWQIPVHPKVYDSDFAYSARFLVEARLRVPESIRQDISAIEIILGKSLNISAGDDALGETDSEFPDELEYDQIRSTVDAGKKAIGLEIGGTNIDLDPVALPRDFIPTARHPMDIEKLRKYAFETMPALIIHTWLFHNPLDYGLIGALYLRNFAIVFNNLGLERI